MTPVINYERMKRLSAPDACPLNYSAMTWVCLFFIVVGILVLIKRFKDKKVLV
jgi:hypothetical protein